MFPQLDWQIIDRMDGVLFAAMLLLIFISALCARIAWSEFRYSRNAHRAQRAERIARQNAFLGEPLAGDHSNRRVTRDPAKEAAMPPQRMKLCPVCGNKRCPKATDENLACTDSNEPGQPGSRFAEAPKRDLVCFLAVDSATKKPRSAFTTSLD